MRTVVWLTEGTWEACVDAVLARPELDQVVLLHVVDPRTSEAWSAAPAGLLGRGRVPDDGGLRAGHEAILDAAAARLGRPVEREVHGHARVETEVVAALRPDDLLVCARDGDRPGPYSLAPPTRFVVDHAPCAVLLVWPG